MYTIKEGLYKVTLKDRKGNIVKETCRIVKRSGMSFDDFMRRLWGQMTTYGSKNPRQLKARKNYTLTVTLLF